MSDSIPTMMQAVQQDAPGGKLVVRQIAVPRPKAGQVLVKMAASPINPSDLGALAGGTYGGERKYPFTPGIEGSGTVVAAGEGVMPGLMKGRRVSCSAILTGDGTWAEYMVTGAQLCVPLNGNVSQEQGAMLLVNPLSALAIFEMAEQGKHKAIVNTAAASALGGMILRLGRRYNLPVIHVVRREAQVGMVREQGGEYVLNSSDANFETQLRAKAEELKATFWLDAIGGAFTQQLAEAAPYNSTFLLYSRLSGANSVIDARTALNKNLHFHGWFLANWLKEKNLLQVILTAQRAQSLLATDLRSPVSKRMPLAAVQEALDTYQKNMTAGKILLVADPQAVKVDG